MRFPHTFYKKERIIRAIYSKKNINPHTNTLKANFFQFRFNEETSKSELSCIRFELSKISKCRYLAKHYEDPKYNRTYYGFGCTRVADILSIEDYGLVFTPILNAIPKNYFHADIFEMYNNKVEIGKANSAIINYNKELFAKRWEAHKDEVIRSRKSLQPPIKIIS